MPDDHAKPARAAHRLTAGGVTWLSLLVNAGLGVARILVGILFASQALIADGLHGASDLVTDLAVLAGLQAAKKPADTDHHYGHRRISTLVGMFVGVVMLAALAWIAVTAVRSIRGDAQGPASPLPLLVAAGTVPVKELLYQLTRRVADRTGNRSIRANAWHQRTDALSSVAAAAGLAGVAIGGEDWAFLDPLTAMVLAAFLAVTAVRIIGASASELIDRAPNQAVLESIAEAVRNTPGVRDYHAFRARELGGKVEMDVHVQVDPDLTVHEGHEIASAVRQRVREADGRVQEVIVHVEPSE